MEIVLACDLVVASTTARFGLPEVARGILPTCGGLFRSARALPLNVAKELLLTGDQLLPQRAYELGLVNRITEPGQALDGALALAERICVNAPVSVRQSLWALEQVNTLTDEQGWTSTTEATRVVRGTDDFREGRTAFFEKRPPNWSGR
jgi:enoyl-CoA hydratase/carnithine racemase